MQKSKEVVQCPIKGSASINSILNSPNNNPVVLLCSWDMNQKCLFLHLMTYSFLLLLLSSSSMNEGLFLKSVIGTPLPLEFYPYYPFLRRRCWNISIITSLYTRYYNLTLDFTTIFCVHLCLPWPLGEYFLELISTSVCVYCWRCFRARS